MESTLMCLLWYETESVLQMTNVSASMQVAMLIWFYVVDMSPTNSLHDSV